MAKRIAKSDGKATTGKTFSKSVKEKSLKRSVASGKNNSSANRSVAAKDTLASGVAGKTHSKSSPKNSVKAPVTNSNVKPKKVNSPKASNTFNSKPAKKSSALVSSSRGAGKKAGTNNTSRSSSNRSSLKDPFSEKLNTVTPSGYKDQTFFEQVFDVARQIPKGRVTSYGAIAASLGAKSSSRMVGWAMNLAGSAKPKVPAHRVVNRNGMLSGKHHFATPTAMQEMLEKEGVVVKDDKVVNFTKLFWDPMDL